MGIQLGGMASGMDTASIISQLMEAERQPVYQKQEEIQKLTQGKQIWESLNSKLTSFKSAVSDLKFASTFSSKTVSSTNADKLTGTAANNASTTSYVLENVVLATPSKISSASALSLSDGTKANITRTATITDGNAKFNTFGSGVVAGSFKLNGKTIQVAADDTVNMVVSKINSAKAGVTAAFDDATDSFTLTATEAGASKKIEIDASDTSGFITKMGLSDKLGQKIDNGVDADQNRVMQDVTGLSSISNGFFTINGITFEVNKATDTLAGIISKINSSSAGVSAFYDGDTKKVTLTSKETGKDLALENDTSGFLAGTGIMNGTGDTDASGTKSVYKGTDASLTINGVNFTKTSNKFTMNGTTFELKSSTTTGEKITLNVKSNTDTAFNKIKSFIDKYNDLIDNIEENSKIETDAGGKTTSGPLQGDSMASNLALNLRQKIMYSVTGLTSGYNMASLMGIEAKDSKSGKLTLDETKLKAALTADAESVQKLFTQSFSGSVTNEGVGTGDGSRVDYSLAKIPSTTTGMTISVGATTYSGTQIITSGTPTAGQVYLNTKTGDIKFGTTPPNGDAIQASYSYDSGNSNEDGIAIRIEKYIKPFTQYNGNISSHIKSYQKNIENINKWINDKNSRLTMREESLKKQFTAMEQAMNQSTSQQQWLAGQLASL